MRMMLRGAPDAGSRGGRRRLFLLDSVAFAVFCSACLVGALPTADEKGTAEDSAPLNKTDESTDSSQPPPPPPPPDPLSASSPPPLGGLSTPSPFALWDEASAEQEAESEQGHQQRDPPPSPHASLLSPPPSGDPTDAAPSFLLVLVGNSTVARLRRRDFAKYVRVNLAARLSVEYDQVTIESVVLAPPSILVNVTVATEGPAGAGPMRALMRMAQSNATLLELSGEEFKVSRVITSTSLLTPKEVAEGSTAALKHEQLERGVFSASGAALAVLILVAIAFGAAARFRRGRCGGAGAKTPPTEPPLPPPPPPPPLRPRRRPLAPPKVIYTGAFALTLGAAGRGTVRMPAGGCAVHHPAMVGRRLGGGPVAGEGWRRKDGRWEDAKGLPGPVRRPCGHPPPAQRHLSPVSAWNATSDIGFDNPNFEK
ncbi:uncharacterized protein C6orf132 homolog [Hetaerina americana]|uniref:uncharacterized protein C6orf132 homolog n=1 Tax=Hetaerina americana TaxID=62018 RepID=UPI003A7F5396